ANRPSQARAGLRSVVARAMVAMSAGVLARPDDWPSGETPVRRRGGSGRQKISRLCGISFGMGHKRGVYLPEAKLVVTNTCVLRVFRRERLQRASRSFPGSS